MDQNLKRRDWPYSRAKPYYATAEWILFEIPTGLETDFVPTVSLVEGMSVDSSDMSSVEAELRLNGLMFDPGYMVRPFHEIGETKAPYTSEIVGFTVGTVYRGKLERLEAHPNNMFFTERDNVFLAIVYASAKPTWYWERNSKYGYEEGKLPGPDEFVVVADVVEFKWKSYPLLLERVNNFFPASPLLAGGVFDSRAEAKSWSDRVARAFAARANDIARTSRIGSANPKTWDYFASEVLPTAERYVLHTKKGAFEQDVPLKYSRHIKVDPKKLMRYLMEHEEQALIPQDG